MIIIVLITKKKQAQELSVSFVNNNEFVKGGKEQQQKIQQILDTYSDYYKVIGRYIKYKKYPFSARNRYRRTVRNKQLISYQRSVLTKRK